MPPILSVIIPMYNIATHLPQCINSLRLQPEQDIEFLFVSDGSPDNSPNIVKDAASDDPRIQLLEKSNGGCASARNYGITHARGRYVGFVDGDDWVERNFFSGMINVARDCEPDIIENKFTKYFEDNNEYEFIDEEYRKTLVDSMTGNILERVPLILGQPTIWRRIYRRKFLRKYNLKFNESFRIFDDLPFQFLTLLHAGSVKIVHEKSYYYRLNRPGQDVEIDDERLHVHFAIFDCLRREVGEIQLRDGFEALKLVSEATHKWGYQQITDELKAEYLVKAVDCNQKTLLLELMSSNEKQNQNNYKTKYKKFVSNFLFRILNIEKN